MEVQTYRWKAGIPTKLAVETFVAHRDELKEIMGREPTPEDIVQDAEAPASPLHDDFQYGNDAQLAHEWRLDHARELLRGVMVVWVRAEHADNAPTEKRFLVSYPDPERTGRRVWAEREIVVTNPDKRTLLLQQWKRDCLQFTQNYFQKYGDDLTEITDVNKVIYHLHKLVAGHTEIND